MQTNTTLIHVNITSILHHHVKYLFQGIIFYCATHNGIISEFKSAGPNCGLEGHFFSKLKWQFFNFHFLTFFLTFSSPSLISFFFFFFCWEDVLSKCMIKGSLYCKLYKKKTQWTLIVYVVKKKIPLKWKNVSYGKGLIQPINFVCPLNLRG